MAAKEKVNPELTATWQDLRKKFEAVAETVFGQDRAREKHDRLTARLIRLPIEGKTEITAPLVDDKTRLNLPVIIISHATDLEKIEFKAFCYTGELGDGWMDIYSDGLRIDTLDLYEPRGTKKLWTLVDPHPDSNFFLEVDPNAGKSLGLMLSRDGSGDLMMTPVVIDLPAGFEAVFDKEIGMMIERP